MGGGKKWRFTNSVLAFFEIFQRIATSFPPLPQSRRVIPSPDLSGRGISGTIDHLSSVIQAENHKSAEK